MRKLLLLTALLVSVISFGFYTFAQENLVLTATLHSETPPAQNVTVGTQQVDMARITLTASGGDIYLTGIELGTETAGGLSNLTDIKIYDVYGTGSGQILKGTAPNQSSNPYLVQFSSYTLIGNGLSRTYLVKAGTSSSASGSVRLGFRGFTFSTQAAPALVNVPIYGNTMTFVDYYGNPIPIPTPVPISTPTPSVGPTPTPSTGQVIPASLGFISLASLGLSEGDTISATGSSDPDIYIVNGWGYKRLFLNPIIFGFYGHLGGFANVKNVASSTRDVMVTSGLFRNCETNDPKVYGVETTGEDTGILHWVNTSGSQAVADDPEFFKKVFCINSAEFNWYSQGSAYTSVTQVPAYSR